jgi:hypothetical protein
MGVKKYLVYVEVGGETGNHICGNAYYTIVEGTIGVSIVQEWCKLNNIIYKNIRFDSHNNCWRVDGYLVRVVELIENFDGIWKQLEWK